VHLLKRFQEISDIVEEKQRLSDDAKLLLGAYFSCEYSLESAALFNPSIVWHPDQSGLPEGSRRFIMSLRATGEGHISSLVFRTGTIDSNYKISMDEITRFVTAPEIVPGSMTKSDYQIQFSENSKISERAIFPMAPDESNGIEDARLVEFTDEYGGRTYCATYTAYDGKTIRPKLAETTDFSTFKIRTLHGSEVKNKGFALFPRTIGGQYAMLSRQDGENNYIMFSDRLDTWNSKQMIMEPKFPWEFVQLGNCGSPLETDRGWLVLSHGVGPMRRYCISAFLLDLKNPTKVIGRLKEPLICPNEDEREGYVPNVVYSCGGMIHNQKLILPYAMSDYASSVALVDLNDIMNEMV
ncbi:glycosidase, partial [candidate division KSB1 bacterium]|nr:glycosidase [candidate division KSB1 bacterium]